MERRDIRPSRFPGGHDLIGKDTGFVIGARGDELLRLDTDAHIVTIAKTGGGKGRSSIIPNLLTHPGSDFFVGEEEISTANRNFPHIAQLLDKYGTEEWDQLMVRFQTDVGPYADVLNGVGNYFSGVGRSEHYDSIISSASQWLSGAN